MNEVLVVEYLISLQHAKTMLRKMLPKKHAKLGYYYILDDLGMKMYDRRLESYYPHLIEKYFATYGETKPLDAYRLRVYRSVPAA